MALRRSRQRLLVFGTVIGGVVLGLFLLRGPLERALLTIGRPLAGAGTWITSRFAGFRSSPEDLRKRVETLEAERGAWALDHVRAETLGKENAQLREQLGYAERSRLQTVTAAIVARSSGLQKNTVVIDRGSSDGVVFGAPVIVGNGLLVGKVRDVRAHASTVTVVSDPSIATAVSLVNETRTIGVAEGLNGTLITVKFIPHDQRVAVNDLVVTSGLEEAVPSGLILGVVNAVRSETTEPFQEAIVEPLADIRLVSLVTVILGRL